MIKKIYHISDVHIRLYGREDEYKRVFDNLYNIINTDSIDSLIVVSGDILDKKVELSPESVDIIFDFFKKLSNISKTIVILGNHDLNLNNRNRLDSISPIIHNIYNDNLIFLDRSGLYYFDNICISNFSILDNKSNYILSSNIEDNYKKLAIYHGSVEGYSLYNDIGVCDYSLDRSYFKGFDIVLLGDIHKCQRISSYNKELCTPEMWYAGSLIQQNFGESLSHGILKWDVENNSCEFIPVDNVYIFHTIYVDAGVISGDLEIMKNKIVNLRVIHYGTNLSDLDKIESNLKNSYDISNIHFSKVKNNVDSNNVVNKVNLFDVYNIDSQNNLLKKYIKSIYEDIDNNLLEDICNLNKKYNNDLSVNSVSLSHSWKLKRLEFSNMFSYSDNNVVDFSKFGGVIGLFGNNASGKSSLLDSLLYCLFDKTSRVVKGGDIINNSKNIFSCIVDFDVDGQEFFIEKKGKRISKSNSIKYNTNFSTIDNDEKVILNGLDRISTNSNIKNYLGEFDTFLMTSITTQNVISSFIDQKQSTRKNILYSFLNIDIFDKLYNIVIEDFKELKSIFNSFKSKNFYDLLKDENKNLEIHSLDLLNFNKEFILIKESFDKLNENILQESLKLNKIVSKNLDLEILLNRRKEITFNFGKNEESIKESELLLQRGEDSLSNVEGLILQYENDEVERKYNDYILKKNYYVDLEKEKSKLDNNLKNSLDKLDKLSKHEYDPNCKYCINNIFVRDAIETKETIKELEKKLIGINNLISFKDADLNKVYYENYKEYNDSKNRLLKIKSAIIDVKNNLLNYRTIKEDNKRKIDYLDNDIRLFEEEKLLIQENEKINERIKSLKGKLLIEKNNLENIQKKINNCNSNIIICKNNINSIENNIKEYELLEKKYNIYEIYVKSIHRDGISYYLLQNIIPFLEEEVNSILKLFSNFYLKFSLLDNDVNIDIVYNEVNKWSIELGSGMEKFISTLCIKIALLDISNLPKPNFLIIDEGFGVLDENNLNSLDSFFDFLKTRFDFILVISHINKLKEIVDNYIEIEKINNYSVIKYN